MFRKVCAAMRNVLFAFGAVDVAAVATSTAASANANAAAAAVGAATAFVRGATAVAAILGVAAIAGAATVGTVAAPTRQLELGKKIVPLQIRDKAPLIDLGTVDHAVGVCGQ